MTTLWQSRSWQHFQEARGFTCTRIQLTHEKVLLIHLSVGYGVQYGYIPRAPKVLEEADFKILENFGTEASLDFIKIDGESGRIFEVSNKLRDSWSPQPHWSRVLDISQSEEDILKQMKRKGRYNIQLSKKRGVTTQHFSGKKAQEMLSHWQQMLEETTTRDGFSGHNKSYYEQFLECIPESELILAKKGEEYIAGAIIVYYQDTAIYYYGVSSSKHRSDMAPYAVQWSAIQSAKKKDCNSYDLFGVAGPDEKNSDWSGITAFKEKFGGELQHRPQTQDFIVSIWKYRWYGLLKTFQRLLKRR